MSGPDSEHWDGCGCEDCTPKPLPPDSRDPITKALGLLAVRYGSDSPPIVEARADLARLTAERNEAIRKRESMAKHLTSVMEELKQAQANVRTATASRPDVWFWQGDGHDEPESLACPVVMEPETLRAILAERDSAHAEAVRIAQVHQHQWVMRAGPREAFARLLDLCDGSSEVKAAMVADYDAALARAEWESARARKAEVERDAALKRVGVRGLDPATLRECDAALNLTDDPRIQSWRGLASSCGATKLMDLMRANAATAVAYFDSEGVELWTSAVAALEALGGRP